MATINPISTSLRMLLSLGEANGKDVTKSVSVGNIRTNADADTLHATAEALATLVEHPVVSIRKSELLSIEE